MTTLTLSALALLAWHYALYPALVMVLARWRPAPPHRRFETAQAQDWPSVTMVIAAYNEARVIEGKILNALALRYPGRLSILIVSDGSSDETPDIVARYAGQGVVGLHAAPRRGKTAALNRAVATVTSDVLVFSDANNDFNEDAVTAMVSHLADPAIGAVCGVKQIRAARDRQSSEGDGLYWRYESAIKLAEGRIGSITNLDGEIFAMRRGLWRDIPEHLINDDAQITFDLIAQGARILYEPAARSTEYASIRIEEDFWVKVRMVAGGFQTFATHWRRLLPPRDGFALAWLSHKALRYLAPLLMLAVLAGSATLAAAGVAWAQLLLGAQAVFYLTAAWGWRRIAAGPLPTPVYVPFYFTAMNLAALFGFWRFVTGRQGTNWRKAQR